MKRTPVTKRSCTAALALALVAITSGSAHAASYTWNTTNGDWDLSATNWSSGASSSLPWAQTGTTSPLHDAYFGGSGYTVTLGATQVAANYLTFWGTTTITGGTLWVGNATASAVNASKTASIGSVLSRHGRGNRQPEWKQHAESERGGKRELSLLFEFQTGLREQWSSQYHGRHIQLLVRCQFFCE